MLDLRRLIDEGADVLITRILASTYGLPVIDHGRGKVYLIHLNLRGKYSKASSVCSNRCGILSSLSALYLLLRGKEYLTIHAPQRVLSKVLRY